MKEYNVQQGSAEWFQLRLGVASASNFSKIITPKGKRSESFSKYRDALIAEMYFGEKPDKPQSGAMLRGIELESEAVDVYYYHSGKPMRQTGFWLSECGRYGASPDMLVADDGLLEIKCPMHQKHLENVQRSISTGVMDMQYYPQVQGQLMLTGRKWCDWMSYFPGKPPIIVRVERDEPYMQELGALLAELSQQIDVRIMDMKKAGHTFAKEPKPL